MRPLSVLLTLLSSASAFRFHSIIPPVRQIITNLAIINGLVPDGIPYDPRPAIRHQVADAFQALNQTLASRQVEPHLDLPLFITDLENPWITEYKAVLSSQQDLTKALCTTNPSDPALISLLRTLRSRRIPPPPSPSSLFNTISIRNGFSRPGYKNAIDRLTEILSCPAALQTVQSLKVDILVWQAEEYGLGPLSKYITDPSVDITSTKNYTWFESIALEENRLQYVDYDEDGEPTGGEEALGLTSRRNFWDLIEPPFALSQLLARVLCGKETPNLKSLSWRVPCRLGPFFERDFERLNLTMSTVKHVFLEDYQEYMLRFAPNLDSLETGMSARSELLCMPTDEAWLASPRLWQSPKDRFYSMIQGLGVGDQVKTYRWSYGSSRHPVTSEDLADLFENFPNLETIHIPAWKTRTRYSKSERRPPVDLNLKYYLNLIAHGSRATCWKSKESLAQDLELFSSIRRDNVGSMSRQSSRSTYWLDKMGHNNINSTVDARTSNSGIITKGHIRKLHLPPLQQVGHQYSTFLLPDILKRWAGPAGERYALRIQKEKREALDRALKDVVDVLPWLEEVWFGDNKHVLNGTST